MKSDAVFSQRFCFSVCHISITYELLFMLNSSNKVVLFTLCFYLHVKTDFPDFSPYIRLILDGAPLIAIHKARYYKRKDGLALGPGPFVTGLEYSTDTKATVVGKPEKTFFLEALRDLNCSPEEAVMIGDVSAMHHVIDTYTVDLKVNLNHCSGFTATGR